MTGTVNVDGVSYPAEPIAGGAAYELFSDLPAPGFLRLSTTGRAAYHRFLPATEVGLNGAGESPLQAPLSRGLTWERIHRLSQSPPREQRVGDAVAAVRASATIRRGTRMVKPLSSLGVAAVLKGQLPHGFCYREWDIAHLRTPAEQAVLTGAHPGEVSYLLRWRAIDPLDYQVPIGERVSGLTVMPPHDRIGSPVLGTGFAPSSSELIPEWMTADFADLPLPANAAVVAYAPDGTEHVLYTYQPEQRGWLRLVGPQWRHLLAPVREVSTEQEYLPLPRGNPSSRLVGMFRGEEFEAIADPPEFRVLAMTRAARYPVESLLRRTRYARWRGALGTVLSTDASWLRIRLCQPDPSNVADLGAQCYERGVYEAWAPATQVTEAHEVEVSYQL
ncbi:hypothetical protein Rhe02_71680 [Rhizocola hellebori]|uniref:Uncharacterized protein n=1 Tax=Rhizocola hellebori TaxID=1392758 RepID=A0A8J3VKI0_9ACTN|nr:hypothetical protein Rhe02_71680 [Rhizocola hellebori]